MEVATSHRLMTITEASQPSSARHAVRALAGAAGFNDDDVHRAGLIATELGTNLVKHARAGQLLARITSSEPDGELELVAIDSGPGMDLRVCYADGYSTAGSLGTGLGAVRRLSDTYSAYSDERGTVIVVRLRRLRRPPKAGAFDLGAISVAKPGEEICGDAWTAQREQGRLLLLIADGLGHGVHAAEAAEAVLQRFRARPYPGGVDALQAIHAGIRHTRGAAVAIAEVARDARVVRYAGVGNVAMAVGHDGALRQGVSHNGTLGHEARVFREYSYPWSEDDLIVMHSDGLASHWRLDGYRGLCTCHPTVIAAALYRDHNRGRDDVTVLVAREAH